MAVLAIHYVRQRFDFTCGPAVLRMVFSFYGLRSGALSVLWHTKPSRTLGTSREMLVRVARKRGLAVHAHSGATWRELSTWVRRGFPVIVNYREPKHLDGHYALVIGVKRDYLILADPYHGPRFRLTRSAFERWWHGTSGRRYGHWLMVAMPPHSQVTGVCSRA